MEKSYSFKSIEEKWQKKWNECSIFKTSETSKNEKYYILEMFPYPSGKMHMGHVRNYTLGDVLARYKKNKGLNVLHPMGWDAFGLPAENAARENNTHPAKWTYENIDYMKNQFKKLGFSIDWDKEVITCSPNYYQHEQSMFIDFFNAGLAYKKESWVNWDPVENTVLANEQVVDGKGWRSGAVVEQKQLNQWFLKITDFAEDLLSDLSLLKNWPEKVKNMQHNWIGKSSGANIYFNVKNSDKKITVYTTRPETIFGGAFIGLSVNHSFSLKLTESNSEIASFIKKIQSAGTIEENIAKEEKKGINTGLLAINPVNGLEIPIFICNYVLDYGTSCIFGCPAHDSRDFEFAKKYNIPFETVIRPENESNSFNVTEAFEEDGVMINSSFLDGLNISDAKTKIISYLEEKSFGEAKINYRLKDWGVSRQRYWGCPIPIIYCDSCGVIPESKENLPIELPIDVDFNQMGNPLVTHPTWKNTKCPKCGGNATRETDTFDTFFESSWYFLRYPTVGKSNPLDPQAINYWLSVNQYIGGIEHAVMHLLYSRFFVKALAKLNILGEQNKNLKEPFNALMTQGMIAHKTYKDSNGKWIYPNEVIFDENNNPIHYETKLPVNIGRSEKMSKSKKNTVDPDYICKVYGADTARMFVLSDSPPDKDLEWTDEGVEGIYKFINRYWRLAQLGINSTNNKLDISKLSEKDKDVYAKIQKYIVEIENNINELHLNKAVALNRELFNLLDSAKNTIDRATLRYGVKILTQTLSPFIPHICEEIWEDLKEDSYISIATWPTPDANYLNTNKVTIAVQILGKTKGSLEVDADISQEDLMNEIKTIPSVAKSLEGATIKKIIYVPKRIINVVI